MNFFPKNHDFERKYQKDIPSNLSVLFLSKIGKDEKKFQKIENLFFGQNKLFFNF